MTDNKDQIEFWSGEGGRKWLASGARIEQSIAQFGAAALKAAAPRAGEHVLDIGCGTGGTSLALAQAVGPSGKVLGLDVSPRLLEAARQRGAGQANLSFIEADAAAHPFEPRFDLLFSRFGVMFFADPLAAFANLRRALKPGGRMAFVCWRAFKDNDWAFVPFMAALKHLPPIERPPADAPGPFAFADQQRVLGILARAGFADAAMTPHDGLLRQGADLDEAMAYVQQIGPASVLLAGAPPDMVEHAKQAVRAAMAPYAQPGGVMLPGEAWIVTARNA